VLSCTRSGIQIWIQKKKNPFTLAQHPLTLTPNASKHFLAPTPSFAPSASWRGFSSYIFSSAPQLPPLPQLPPCPPSMPAPVPTTSTLTLTPMPTLQASWVCMPCLTPWHSTPSRLPTHTTLLPCPPHQLMPKGSVEDGMDDALCLTWVDIQRLASIKACTTTYANSSFIFYGSKLIVSKSKHEYVTAICFSPSLTACTCHAHAYTGNVHALTRCLHC
jgi:hypothetical protein